MKNECGEFISVVKVRLISQRVPLEMDPNGIVRIIEIELRLDRKVYRLIEAGASFERRRHRAN